jgi:hypothetical protein
MQETNEDRSKQPITQENFAHMENMIKDDSQLTYRDIEEASDVSLPSVSALQNQN